MKELLEKNKKGTIIGCLIADGIISVLISAIVLLEGGGFGDVVTTVIIVSLLSFATGYFIYKGENERIKRSFCPNCETKYDYEDDVSWEVTQENVSYPKSNSSSSNDVYARRTAVLEFSCECSCCGHVTGFSKNFEIAVQYNNGNIREKNIRTEARKYFVK